MFPTIAQDLHDAIAAVAPVVGVSIGSMEDRKTWVFTLRDDATKEQKAAATAALAAFDPSAPMTRTPSADERLAKLEAMVANLEKPE